MTRNVPTLQFVLIRKTKGSLTLYSLNSPWTEFRSTGFQWMITLVLSTFDTRRSVGASVGSEHIQVDTICVNSQQYFQNKFSVWFSLFLITRVALINEKLLRSQDLLTVFSRVSDDQVRLWSCSKLIPGLDFDLIRHIDFCIVDHMFGPHCGHVIPLLFNVFSSPPHSVVQVWTISFQIKERLEKSTER